MKIDSLMVVIFVVLVLIGSYHTFIQRTIAYAMKAGIDPMLALPDGLRKSPAILIMIPIAVWTLRVTLFALVFRENDLRVSIVTVIAAWFSQMALYWCYPHKIENLEK